MNNKTKHQSLSSKAIRIHNTAFVLKFLATYFPMYQVQLFSAPESTQVLKTRLGSICFMRTQAGLHKYFLANKIRSKHEKKLHPKIAL